MDYGIRFLFFGSYYLVRKVVFSPFIHQASTLQDRFACAQICWTLTSLAREMLAYRSPLKLGKGVWERSKLEGASGFSCRA